MNRGGKSGSVGDRKLPNPFLRDKDRQKAAERSAGDTPSTSGNSRAGSSRMFGEGASSSAACPQRSAEEPKLSPSTSRPASQGRYSGGKRGRNAKQPPTRRSSQREAQSSSSTVTRRGSARVPAAKTTSGKGKARGRKAVREERIDSSASDSEDDSSSASSSSSSSGSGADGGDSTDNDDEEDAALAVEMADVGKPDARGRNTRDGAKGTNAAARGKNASDSDSDEADEGKKARKKSDAKRPLDDSDDEDSEAKRPKYDLEEDTNVCSWDRLHSLFSAPYHVANSVDVRLVNDCVPGDVYVLHSDANRNRGDPSIAVGLSNSCVHIYNAESLTLLARLKGHDESVSGVKFAHTQPAVLFTGSTKGMIRLWDLRTKPYSCAASYSSLKFSALSKRQKIVNYVETFDVDCTDKILCAGTVHNYDDAYLLFWDIRACKGLGGYFHSHSNDITQVAFHPTEKRVVASASVDGLVDIFDLQKRDEDEALSSVLSTGVSVRRLGWFTGGNRANPCDNISVVTSHEDIQFWNKGDAQPYDRFSREDIAAAMKRSSVSHAYVAGIHQRPLSKELFILTGSNSDRTRFHFDWSPSRYCIRLFKYKPGVRGVLSPYAMFDSRDCGELETIRTTHFFPETEVFMTGGEKGMLCMWTPGVNPATL